MPNVTGYEYNREKLVMELDDGTTKIVRELSPDDFGKFNARFNGKHQDDKGDIVDVPKIADSAKLLEGLTSV